MMTSKPEDRLRKNGVKTRKYYKWLRWSMKYLNIAKLSYIFLSNSNYIDFITIYFLVSSVGTR